METSLDWKQRKKKKKVLKLGKEGQSSHEERNNSKEKSLTKKNLSGQTRLFFLGITVDQV